MEAFEFAWAGYTEIAIVAIMLVSSLAVAIGDWRGFAQPAATA